MTPGFGRGRRALVVDDEPSIVRVCERALARAGFEVTTAADLRGALAAVEGAPALDLLVCDQRIGPEECGDDVIEAARRRFPELPVVRIFGVSLGVPPEDERSRSLEKPFDLSRFLEVVRRVLGEPD